MPQAGWRKLSGFATLSAEVRMTLSVWNNAEHPLDMYQATWGMADCRRKFGLFACACWRGILPGLGMSVEPLLAIEARIDETHVDSRWREDLFLAFEGKTFAMVWTEDSQLIPDW
ncbi:MAG: hypothetical protein AB7K24_30655, partial [Gemmataceae bacterium]